MALALSVPSARLELCAALELGGLTPSLGTLDGVPESSRPRVVVLVRPRAGDFFYDDGEFAAMRRDVATVAAMGFGGVAVGE